MTDDELDLHRGVFAVLENMALVEGKHVVAACCAQFLASNYPGVLGKEQLEALGAAQDQYNFHS